MSLHLMLAFYATAIGLVVGSFLNVVIHRLPRGISVVSPRSSCPGCGKPVAARDNVPVLSWLWLRGRCRHCQAPISPRYPLIEALCGLLFLGCYLRFGMTVDGAVAALFCGMMIALGGIDAEHYLLPDVLTLPGIVLGLVFSPFVSWTTPGAAALGAALGAGLLLAVSGGWYLLRREEGMGLGDVKMLAMIGAFLGWQGTLITLFLSTLTGAVVGVAMIAFGRGGMKSKLAFGTFLAIAGVITLFVGQEIADYYAGLLYRGPP